MRKFCFKPKTIMWFKPGISWKTQWGIIEQLQKILKEAKRSLMKKQQELETIKTECENLRFRNDSVELSFNRVASDYRRLSSNKNDFETIDWCSSNTSYEVFSSSAKFKNNVPFVKKIVAPYVDRPCSIMSCRIENNDMKNITPKLQKKIKSRLSLCLRRIRR